VAHSTCRLCRRPLILALTARGRRQPLDATPNPDGNVLAYQDDRQVWHARSMRADGVPQRPWEEVYMPHFATCPMRARQLVLPIAVTRPRPDGIADLAAARARRRPP